MKQKLVVGAAILDSLTEPSQVLCAQRAYPPELAGQWELPGGKVEPGEAPENALHRELAEEIAARIVLGPLLPGPTPSGDWPIPSHPTRLLRVFLAELAPGKRIRRGPDHLRLESHGANTVESLHWLPADQPIANQLAELLRRKGS